MTFVLAFFQQFFTFVLGIVWIIFNAIFSGGPSGGF